MDAIIDFLRANPVQFLATVGLDGKPRVRPFQFMLADAGRLWFCTNNKKEVFTELQKLPYIELSASSPDNVWLRLSAKVVFSDSLDIKNRIVAVSPLVKSIYGSGDNPELEAFSLEDGKATIADFSGNPPKSYVF